MAVTAHVYQIYIAATPAQVWTAITDAEWTSKYFHSTSFVEPPQQGESYRTVLPDGQPAIEGVVEVMTPPVAGAAGRFVQTWRVLYDPAMADEPPSRVEWDIEEAGPGLTRVRLTHGDLAFSPLTWANVKDGWVWVLDSMKSLLETGTALPRAIELDKTEPPTDGDWHRAQAVAANNAAWELISRRNRPADGSEASHPEPTRVVHDHPEPNRDQHAQDQDEQLLRAAYTAAYHWQRATGATPANEARASYLIAKALLLGGQPVASLAAAQRSLQVCVANGLVDFDLAYGHEACARALLALGRTDEAAAAWASATAVTVADPEDREIVEADFADYPG